MSAADLGLADSALHVACGWIWGHGVSIRVRRQGGRAHRPSRPKPPVAGRQQARRRGSRCGPSSISTIGRGAGDPTSTRPSMPSSRSPRATGTRRRPPTGSAGTSSYEVVEHVPGNGSSCARPRDRSRWRRPTPGSSGRDDDDLAQPRRAQRLLQGRGPAHGDRHATREPQGPSAAESTPRTRVTWRSCGESGACVCPTSRKMVITGSRCAASSARRRRPLRAPRRSSGSRPGTARARSRIRHRSPSAPLDAASRRQATRHRGTR